jgi:hypothetical protein
MKLLFRDGNVYETFYNLSQFIYQNTNSTYKISYDRAMFLLYQFFITLKGYDELEIITALIKDITKVSGRKLPKFLIEFDKEYKLSPHWNKKIDKMANKRDNAKDSKIHLNKRQIKHL